VSVHEATVALAEYQAIEAWAKGPQSGWGFTASRRTIDGRLSLQAGMDPHHHRQPAQWKSFCDVMGIAELGAIPTR